MIILTLVLSLTASAQDTQSKNNYLWDKEPNTGKEIAASLAQGPINFLVVGDLSKYGYYLIDSFFSVLADASRIEVDRTKKDHVLLVIQDRNVFSRLKDDRSYFSSLGIPADILNLLASQLKDDTKCLFGTFPKGRRDSHDIGASVVLLSTEYAQCLPKIIFHTFGIIADKADLSAILSACALYEGRRRGIRERRALADERSKLIAECTKRVEWNP